MTHFNKNIQIYMAINIVFEQCNWQNPEHTGAFLNLLNHYMSDPMGDYPPLNEHDKQKLLVHLSNHPTVEVLLMKYENDYAGMATTFINYSTFKLKPYMYIHDVVVLDKYRGKGLGKALIRELINISENRDYCKLTLEVREDNPAAQQVYKNLGFEECKPRMYFWERKITK